MKRLALAVAIASVTLAAVAPAQDGSRPPAGDAPAPAEEGLDPAQEARARRFLEVSGRARLAEALLENMVAELETRPGLPDGFIEALRASARPEDLLERLVPVYAQLDAEVLDAATAFYETAPGRRLAEAQGQLSADEQTAGGAWAQEAIRGALRKLGLPTPEENLQEARRHGNEAAAIGALRTIATAQALFREGDKDDDGTFDYAGSLAELATDYLIDEVLASGEKQGYRFELCRGNEAPEFLWMAVAHPIEPGVSGERWFVTNHAGVIFYSTEGPFELDRESCKIPEDATPVGR